jgi:DNA-binding CsgD family transcriptional regulator
MLFIDAIPGHGGAPRAQRSDTRLERARRYAALGAELRRSGRRVEAREPLRRAVDLAHECGATDLVAEALGELRATGARPRRPRITGVAALTRSERRITALAADGRLNREIAQELFVTIQTVEFHLRNAYRKLGITSRAELGHALGRPRHRGGLPTRLDIRLL